MEVPMLELGESSRTPHVHVDVVGSNVVVTVDDALLDTQDTTKSTLQDFSIPQSAVSRETNDTTSTDPLTHEGVDSES